MPGPARKSLVAFASWLETERKASRVTINTYCSAIRRLSRLAPDLYDETALRAALDSLTLTSLPGMLSAWSAFRAFARDLNGTELPELTRPRPPRAPGSEHPLLDAELPELPLAVLEIVRASALHGWTVEAWGGMTWDHATTVAPVRGVDHLVFQRPGEKVGLSLPGSEALRLLSWGQPGVRDVPEAPPGSLLLPQAPGSALPFPAWRLRGLLQR